MKDLTTRGTTGNLEFAVLHTKNRFPLRTRGSRLTVQRIRNNPVPTHGMICRHEDKKAALQETCQRDRPKSPPNDWREGQSNRARAPGPRQNHLT
jgi:hypothetical protein